MKTWKQVNESLAQCVRRVVQKATGKAPAKSAKIKLLTHLQYFGYCFNPISVYYVYNSSNTAVETVIAEVSNTPWMEMHLYILADGASGVQAAWTRLHSSQPITDEELMSYGKSSSDQDTAVGKRRKSVQGAMPLGLSPTTETGSRQASRALSAARSSNKVGTRSPSPASKKRVDRLEDPAASVSASASASPSFLPYGTRLLCYRWEKDFHVSPFMDLEQTYHWAFAEPGEVLYTRSVNTRRKTGEKLFTTQLRLTRVPGAGTDGQTTALQIAWAIFVAFPLLTWRLQWWIHYEAVRLFRKGVGLYPHPTGASNTFTRSVEGMVSLGFTLLGVYQAVRAALCCKRVKG